MRWLDWLTSLPIRSNEILVPLERPCAFDRSSSAPGHMERPATG
jgi:hypothetical protein